MQWSIIWRIQDASLRFYYTEHKFIVSWFPKNRSICKLSLASQFLLAIYHLNKNFFFFFPKEAKVEAKQVKRIFIRVNFQMLLELRAAKRGCNKMTDKRASRLEKSLLPMIWSFFLCGEDRVTTFNQDICSRYPRYIKILHFV